MALMLELALPTRCPWTDSTAFLRTLPLVLNCINRKQKRESLPKSGHHSVVFIPDVGATTALATRYNRKALALRPWDHGLPKKQNTHTHTHTH